MMSLKYGNTRILDPTDSHRPFLSWRWHVREDFVDLKIVLTMELNPLRPSLKSINRLVRPFFLIPNCILANFHHTIITSFICLYIVPYNGYCKNNSYGTLIISTIGILFLNIIFIFYSNA